MVVALMETITRLLLALLILCFVRKEFLPNIDAHLTNCFESDREALIDFKNGVDDPTNLLSSWKGSNCCQWWGIRCDNTSGAVIAVDLRSSQSSYFNESSGRFVYSELGGEVTPSLMKLKSLMHLDLSFNNFSNIPIPEFFGSFKNLQYLNLSNAGWFDGLVLPNLGKLSSLQYLDVTSLGLKVNNLKWITGLVSLKHLVLNGNDLSMVGLDWIRTINNLPSLTELHLSSCSLSGSIPQLAFVNLTSLAVLDFSYNQFHSKIPDWLVNISSLVTLDMSGCGLFGSIPLGFRDLPNLQFLNLERNILAASCHLLLEGRWDKIRVLDLAYNSVHGRLPASIGNMTFVTHLDISFNNIEGGIPSSIGNLCYLTLLDLKSNNMNGTLPEFLEGTENCPFRKPLSGLQHLRLLDNRLVGKLPEWLTQLENLVELDLSNNSLCGHIPTSFGISLKNLTYLHLGWNELNGTLPESLGQLAKLDTLILSSNQLTGIVTETHFLKQANLMVLDLSSNSFTWNVSSNWIPPFQVWYLHMGSCNLGPSISTWLKSQKQLSYLDISNTSISGSIPKWFWEFSSSLSYLNLSFNQLGGQLPSPLEYSSSAIVDFSSNNFSGSIPVLISGFALLDLSKNKLSGRIPNNISQSMDFFSIADNQIYGEIPASIGNIPHLKVFHLSNNNLIGSIPSSIGNCSFLSVLDISNNYISGTIPTSLGQLSELQTLHLNHNNLSGLLPLSFQNLSRLETLNIGNNRLTGRLPPWIGKGFESLRFLSLRSNLFSGELPALLSNLSSLQILDLADNQFTGSIPASFGHFKAMLQVQIINHYLSYTSYPQFPCIGFDNSCDSSQTPDQGRYGESFSVYMKGSLLRYSKTLSLVVGIDLSSNNLSGDLPTEITGLLGLRFLDLSRNQITGNIPESISKLKQLLSLDLSCNRFSGAIPQSLSNLSSLGYLNLSNNYFSGRIPYTGHLTTFEAPFFAGNLGLCGDPLAVKCQGDEEDGGQPDKGWRILQDNSDSDSFIDNWFYLSIGLGFAAGILVPILVMVMRRSWSIAYFDAVDKVLDRILFLWQKYRTRQQRTMHHHQRR